MVAQIDVVGQVAVVGQGDAAAFQVGVERLDIAQEAAAGGGVAGMADGRPAGQALDHVRSAEGFPDVAGLAVVMEALAVVAGDAAGLLAAVLQGVQAQRGEGAGRVVAEHAEHAALQPEGVLIDLGRRQVPLQLSAHRVFSTRSSTLLREEASYPGPSDVGDGTSPDPPTTLWATADPSGPRAIST